jgi:hypothetical protein
VARLTSSSGSGMGALFKVIAFAHPKLGALPAFEDWQGDEDSRRGHLFDKPKTRA